MEIERFIDANKRTIEVHVNMGREVSIYQKYPEQGTILDSSVAFLPLTVLQDILSFCEECQRNPKVTVNGTKITERSVALSCGNMQVIACFDLQEFVSIRNSFPDADGTTFRSQISHLLLASLEEAVAFGKKCEQGFLAMLERAKAGETHLFISGESASQNETQAF
ncbi:MAG TPA: hypothetical protein VGE97_10475 [Nitrososphaera sp.]